jgi:isopenicillin-N epimerase
MHDYDRDPQSSLTRRQLLTTTLSGALGTSLLGRTNPTLAQPFDLPTTSRELWQWVRVQPVTDARAAWFNTAAAAPTLRVAMASEYRAREAQSSELAAYSENSRWSQESTRLATRFATFIGCDADELVFTRGAGEAISHVAGGLDLASGDEIVTTNQEHPAALSPWLFAARRRGIVVRQIDLKTPASTSAQIVEAFAAAITDKTRLLAFNHVQCADGTVMPVRELCELARERKVISVVDGAQALGMLGFLVRDLGCDFYAAGFHKWLGGCQGTGMLYVRREMLDRLWPTEPRGIDASPPVAVPVQSPGHVDAPAALHKFGNVIPHLWPALKGSEAALDFQEQVNRARIEARIRELVIFARMRLQQLPGAELLTPGAPGLWAGILTFRLPGRSATEVVSALARINRVHCAALDWPAAADSALRLSLHMFNSHDEIERLMQGLLQLPKL